MKMKHILLAAAVTLAASLLALPAAAFAAEFNTPEPITQNGVTATVSFDKESPQPEGTDITATVTLSGTATEAGIHTIALFSDTAEFWGIAHDMPVTAGQTSFTEFDYDFTLPAEAVDDLTLDHTFVQPKDYTLVLFEGKGYENNEISGDEVNLAELGISSVGTADGYTYTFDSVNFVTTENIALQIRDTDAAIVLTGDSQVKSGNTWGDSYGITASGNLTISGDGMLSVFAGGCDKWSSWGITVAADFTVDSGYVMAFAGSAPEGSYGIYVNDGSFAVNGGSVMAFGDKAGEYDSCGIAVNYGELVVTGGSVEGVSSDSTGGGSYGIFANNGVEVSGGEVRGNAGVSAKASIGIPVYSLGDFKVEGGSVEANGGPAPYSAGIDIYKGDFTVTGGEVFARGDGSEDIESSVGIFVPGTCTITGGEVELSGRTLASAGMALAPNAPKTRDEHGVNVMGVDAGLNADGSDATNVEGWVGDGSDNVGEYKYLHLFFNAEEDPEDPGDTPEDPEDPGDTPEDPEDPGDVPEEPGDTPEESDDTPAGTVIPKTGDNSGATLWIALASASLLGVLAALIGRRRFANGLGR